MKNICLKLAKTIFNIVIFKEIGSLVSIFSLLILFFIFTLPLLTIINQNVNAKEEVRKRSNLDSVNRWIPKSELDKSEVILSFDFTYSPIIKNNFPMVTRWTFIWARSKYFRLIITIILSITIIILTAFLKKEIMNEVNILLVFTIMIIGFLMFFSLLLPHMSLIHLAH